jgi:hypothetical protein
MCYAWSMLKNGKNVSSTVARQSGWNEYRTVRVTDKLPRMQFRFSLWKSYPKRWHSIAFTYVQHEDWWLLCGLFCVESFLHLISVYHRNFIGCARFSVRRSEDSFLRGSNFALFRHSTAQKTWSGIAIERLITWIKHLSSWHDIIAITGNR